VAPHLVMARLVPAIPIIGHCAILIEIAGASLDKPGDDATSFAPVTLIGRIWRRCQRRRRVTLALCSPTALLAWVTWHPGSIPEALHGDGT
jgi:hypothetical protein